MTSDDIDRFRRAIDVMARVVRAQITMEGMKAENMQRARLGQSMAYTEAQFDEVITNEHIGNNDIVEDLYR